MPDRIEREIEEILSRLDEGPKPRPEPVPLGRRRPQASARPSLRENLPALMFGGAGVMLLGLLLTTIADAFIWLAFGGVVMFIAAFVLSFLRGWPGRSRPGDRGRRGVFWRDRYIEYGDDESPSKRRFRR